MTDTGPPYWSQRHIPYFSRLHPLRYGYPGTRFLPEESGFVRNPARFASFFLNWHLTMYLRRHCLECPYGRVWVSFVAMKTPLPANFSFQPIGQRSYRETGLD